MVACMWCEAALPERQSGRGRPRMFCEGCAVPHDRYSRSVARDAVDAMPGSTPRDRWEAYLAVHASLAQQARRARQLWIDHGLPYRGPDACQAPECPLPRQGNRAFCGRHLWQVHKHGRLGSLTVVRTCESPECRSSFSTKASGRARYCSKSCMWREKHKRQAAAGTRTKKRTPAQWKAKNHKRRAAKYGVGYEPFADAEIFDRDGWVCGICGRRVKPSRHHRDQDGPSIDHIIPLSAGGTHSRTNVRLTHLRCNVRRSAGGFAQLRLPMDGIN